MQRAQDGVLESLTKESGGTFVDELWWESRSSTGVSGDGNQSLQIMYLDRNPTGTRSLWSNRGKPSMVATISPFRRRERPRGSQVFYP